MAQTKPKAAQFYGVPDNGTAGQVLISDGNGGMTWGANTEQFTVSWNTPTGQGLTYTQPSPQSSEGTAGSAFPTTTFTATPLLGEGIVGTATIAGLPTGITATQSLSGTGINNVLTVTLGGVFPGADSLNTALTLSGLTIVPPLTVDYLVVAGGGGGGGTRNNITSSGAGGGGAGGYRNSYNSESSGGGQSSESSLSLLTSTDYTVTIGSGGNGAPSDTVNGSSGSNSVFSTITSIGGGGGKGTTGAANALSGGSGGGGGSTGGAAVTSPVIHGYKGGTGGNGGGNGGGGGGGAGSVGSNASTTDGGDGGSGLSSSITGTPSVQRAGGGGGGAGSSSTNYGNGTFGGGDGGKPSAATAGAVNKGAGGGGGGSGSQNSAETFGKSGGSGVVILRYPNTYTITIGAGLTGSTDTDAFTDYDVTTFTAGTGTITFGVA